MNRALRNGMMQMPTNNSIELGLGEITMAWGIRGVRVDCYLEFVIRLKLMQNL